MKILKTVLIALGLIVILFFVVAIFIPTKYTVSVSGVINQPRPVVYEYIKMLENQKYYSEWVKQDLEHIPVITGVDGTVGAIQKWDSPNDNVGKGEQEITHLSLERIDVDLRFERPYESQAKASDILDSLSPTKTRITMDFYNLEDSYPMHVFNYFFARSIIEEVHKKNIENLKEILEEPKS